MRLAAVSVDLDEIPCYAAIHGLGEAPANAAWAIYRHALERFVELFAARGVPATFFAVGRDALDPLAGQALAMLRERGHEVANHSHDHFYDFSRRDGPSIARQIGDASDAIETATGQRPVGFRAPGYTVTDVVFEALREAGMRYDSSVFPCPSYYGAKSLAMAAIRLRGRRSRSVLDTPQVLRAPADPYRVGRPYYAAARSVQAGETAQQALWELPIGVTRWARLPYIGTSLTLGGAPMARALTQAIVGRPLVNLELHGIDLADADADGLTFLRAHQPDLRKPLASKLASLTAAIDALEDAGYRFVTLARATELLSSESGATRDTDTP